MARKTRTARTCDTCWGTGKVLMPAGKPDASGAYAVADFVDTPCPRCTCRSAR